MSPVYEIPRPKTKMILELTLIISIDLFGGYAFYLYSSEHCGFRSPGPQRRTRGHRKGNIKLWVVTATWFLCAPQMWAFPWMKCVLRWRWGTAKGRDSSGTSAAKLLLASEGSEWLHPEDGGMGCQPRHLLWSVLVAWIHISCVKIYPNWKWLPQNSGWFLFLRKITGN